MSERLTARQAAEEAGVSLRSIQAYAIKGVIPGARQIVQGGNWSFDAAKFRRWLEKKEDPRCQETPPTCTSAARRGGDAFRFAGAKSVEAYRRAIGLKPKGA